MTSWVLPAWACGECNAEELGVTVSCGCCDGSFSVPPEKARFAVAHIRNADEIDRLRRVERDHKNVLRAALLEPNGMDLANRLTRYALDNRAKSAE
jgi:hypothetical protein